MTALAPSGHVAPSAGVWDGWQPEALPEGDPDLDALIRWVHRLLGGEVAGTRATFGALADDEYRGLYVPDAEVEVLSAGPPDLPDELARQRATLDAERAEIER